MEGLIGNNTGWAAGLVLVGALAAAALLKNLFFSAGRFMDREIKPVSDRVACCENDIEKHDERLRGVENNLSSINTLLKSMCKKLDKLNNGR